MRPNQAVVWVFLLLALAAVNISFGNAASQLEDDNKELERSFMQHDDNKEAKKLLFGFWENFWGGGGKKKPVPAPEPAPAPAPLPETTVAPAPAPAPSAEGLDDLELELNESIEILLNCLGHIKTQWKYLDGRTADNSVGLAPSFNAPYIGTVWILKNIGGGYVTLVCKVNGRYLVGTVDNNGVKLSPNPEENGSRWIVGGNRKTGYTFKLATGNKFLDGRTVDGSVGLADSTGGGFTGTFWELQVPGTGVLYIPVIGHGWVLGRYYGHHGIGRGKGRRYYGLHGIRWGKGRRYYRLNGFGKGKGHRYYRLNGIRWGKGRRYYHLHGFGKGRGRRYYRLHGFGKGKGRRYYRLYGFGKGKGRRYYRLHGFGKGRGRRYYRLNGIRWGKGRRYYRFHGFGKGKGRRYYGFIHGGSGKGRRYYGFIHGGSGKGRRYYGFIHGGSGKGRRYYGLIHGGSGKGRRYYGFINGGSGKGRRYYGHNGFGWGRRRRYYGHWRRGHDLDLRYGDSVDVILNCLGDIKTNFKYLDGRTADNSVGLAPSYEAPYIGTVWRLRFYGYYVTLECVVNGRLLVAIWSEGVVTLKPSTNQAGTRWIIRGNRKRGYSFKVLGGKNKKFRYLDGRTQDGSVGLAPSREKPYSGTWWELLSSTTHQRVPPFGVGVLITSGDGVDDLHLAEGESIEILLNCLGHVKTQWKYLDGRTADNSVGLAPSYNAPYIGTVWILTNVGGYVTLVCKVNGRYLIGTADNNGVKLSPNEDENGGRWIVGGNGKTGYTFKLVTGDKYLDGHTVDGTVGLAPSTTGGFTGTFWEFQVPGTGVVYVPKRPDHGNGGSKGRYYINQGSGSGHGHRYYGHWSHGHDLDLDYGEAVDVILNCLGDIKTNFKYLDGRTADNSVGLAPSYEAPYVGTVWRLRFYGYYVTLECVVNGRLLVAIWSEGVVTLKPSTNQAGTRWIIRGNRRRGYTFKVLGGKNKKFRYLDGRTQDGSVGLAPSREKPYSGTWWEIISVKTHKRVPPFHEEEFEEPSNTTAAPEPEEPTEGPNPVEPTGAPQPEEPTEAPKPDEPTEAPKPDEPTEAPKPDEPTEAPKPDEPTEAPKPDEPTEAPVVYSSSWLSSGPGWVSTYYTTSMFYSMSEPDVTWASSWDDDNTDIAGDGSYTSGSPFGSVVHTVISSFVSISQGSSWVSSGTF